MDPVMFSGGQPAAFGVAAFCTVVLPVILLIVLGVMKKISAGPLFLGFASFFVSQMVLRIPLLQVLGGQSWFQSFAAHTAVYALVVGGFTAGLFEETARLAGAAVLKKKLSYKSMLSFGLGHGLCEVILIAGMSQVNNLILCAALADPQGAAATAFLSGADPATLQAVAAQLTAATPALVGLALVERVSAVLYHLPGVHGGEAGQAALLRRGAFGAHPVQFPGGDAERLGGPLDYGSGAAGRGRVLWAVCMARPALVRRALRRGRAHRAAGFAGRDGVTRGPAQRAV